MKNLTFLDKILYLVNSLFAALLLLSFLLPYISPKTIPVFAVLSLFVPVLLIINVVFTIYWLLKLKKQVLLSFITLSIGWFFTAPFYKISSTNSSLNSDLKVMSYNVKPFDLFVPEKTDILKQNGLVYHKTFACYE